MAYDENKPDCGQREEMVKRHARIMGHPHVTRCFGFFVIDNEYKLVLELMECSLQDVIGAFSLIISKNSNAQIITSPNVVDIKRATSCAGCEMLPMLFTTFTVCTAVLTPSERLLCTTVT